MAKSTPNTNMLEKITEIRDLARELADRMREVRREANDSYMQTESPTASNVTNHMGQAKNSVAAALTHIDNALDAL